MRTDTKPQADTKDVYRCSEILTLIMGDEERTKKDGSTFVLDQGGAILAVAKAPQVLEVFQWFGEDVCQ